MNLNLRRLGGRASAAASLPRAGNAAPPAHSLDHAARAATAATLAAALIATSSLSPALAAAEAGWGSRSASTEAAADNPALTRRPGDVLLDPARIKVVYNTVLPPPPGPPPPLPPITPSTISRATLPNGLRLLSLRDAEVPLVQGSLLLRGGQAASPADKVGTASITAAVQRAGGSKQHPAAVMDARLEDLAAAIESVAGPGALSIEFECASEDLGEVLGLVGELVTSPAFPQDKLDVTKGQVLESLAHRNDNAASVARRELRKLVLGPDSPWARTPTPEGVRSITRDDLAAFWAAWERPDSAVLAVVGDFDPQQLEESVRSAFGKWSPAPGQPSVPREPPADGGFTSGAGWQAAGGRGADAPVWLVDRPGAAQASVATGEPGASLLDTDAFALSVLNGSLNGFGGSLFDTLRTQEGLCYSVSGGWELPFDRPGLFVAGGETSRPAPFLSELRRVLGDAAARTVPEERLERAKQEKLNSFVFNFATPGSQLQRAAAYEVLGVPQDFLTTYRDGIERVTAADVLSAARTRLHPTKQPAVVVADAATTGPALRAAGFTVIPWDPDAPVDAAAAAGGSRGGGIAVGRAVAVEGNVQ